MQLQIKSVSYSLSSVYLLFQRNELYTTNLDNNELYDCYNLDFFALTQWILHNIIYLTSYTLRVFIIFIQLQVGPQMPKIYTWPPISPSL